MSSERSPLLENGVPPAILVNEEFYDGLVPPLPELALVLSRADFGVSPPNPLSNVTVSREYALRIAVVLHNSCKTPAVERATQRSHLLHRHWQNYVYTLTEQPSSETDRLFGDGSISQLLWEPILLCRSDSPEFTNVAELLVNSSLAGSLLQYELISNRIFADWTTGVQWPASRPPGSTMESLSRKLKSYVSPRTTHALDFVAHLSSLISIANAIMRLEVPLLESSALDIWIITYAISSITRWRRPILYISSIFTLLAYIISYPNAPSPESVSHYLLLFSFAWSSILLVFPVSPGWFLILPSALALPPAVDLAALLWPVILRPLIFFLPTTLLLIFLLSRAMDDPWPITVSYWAPQTSPWSTRLVFFALICLCLVLLLLVGLATITRSNPSVSAQARTPHTPYSFDGAYSPIDTSPSTSTLLSSTSIAATSAILAETLIYSRQYPFPPPLNLVPFFFVTVPDFAWRQISKPDGNAIGRPCILQKVEAGIWWLTVFPCSFVLAGLWAWRSPHLLPDDFQR